MDLVVRVVVGQGEVLEEEAVGSEEQELLRVVWDGRTVPELHARRAAEVVEALNYAFYRLSQEGRLVLPPGGTPGARERAALFCFSLVRGALRRPDARFSVARAL
jgi:hypothetical protein